ncbi:MAG: polysaccharide deacetylase family protein [Leptospirales bacterium]
MMDRKAIVLMYHQIVPEGSSEGWLPSPLADPRYGVGAHEFIQQMRYLRKAGFFLASFDEWCQGVLSPDLLRKPAVIITFDDGYASDYNLAGPILSGFGIPATFFVSTGHLGLPGMMTGPNVEDLSRNPLFEVGAHGESHRFLTTLSDGECLLELNRSISRIRALTGINKPAMSAPGGRLNPSVVLAAQKTGFRALMTSRAGLLLDGGDLFSIPRLPIMKRHSLEDFKQLLNPQSWAFRFDRWVRASKQGLRSLASAVGVKDRIAINPDPPFGKK